MIDFAPLNCKIFPSLPYCITESIDIVLSFLLKSSWTYLVLFHYISLYPRHALTCSLLGELERSFRVSTTRGQQLIGKELGSCVLERLLGYGGSSAVYLAQQQTPYRKVAVKVFLPRNTMDVQMQRTFYTRFLHEAEAASELDYPTILPIYAYGEQDALPYIVMPYMPGGTLAEYIEKQGPLSLEEAQLYLEQLSSALDYAHAHHCVHCDVKPANILLDGQGHAMLSDFGIARVTHLDAINNHSLRRSPETLMGTPEYISPEQALGQHLDGRSDVYSLGVTLFYLLTGSPPFKVDDPIAMALLHVHEPPPLLSMFRDDISPALDSVMNKALAKWPEDRFQTAGEFSAAFSKAISDPESFDQLGLTHENSKTSRNLRNTPKLIPASSMPSAHMHVKPVQRRKSSLSRTLFMIVLVVAVLGATITAALIIWQANTQHNRQNLLLTPTATKTIQDILADDQSGWIPISGQDTFINGQYHILNTSPSDSALALYEPSETFPYPDFNLTVTMSEVHTLSDSPGYYGVIFRSTTDESHYYLFEVTATGAGQGGQYQFLRYDANIKPYPWVILAPTGQTTGSIPSFLSNPGQRNTITIDAKGNSFTFSINGKQVGAFVDPSKSALASGALGLFVEDQGTEVIFSNMQVKRL